MSDITSTQSDDDSSDHTVHASAPAVVRCRVGERLGDYELVEHLGAGGMGEVFGATHALTRAQVALKTLTGVAPRRLYRFKREYRTLEQLSHPNLVSLGELVIDDAGACYFTMERVDGGAFVDWVRGGLEPGTPPDPERLRDALAQLTEGIAHLHARGFIHRDLKPANVLVTPSGRVVILDFGLVSEQDEGGVTQDGQLLGTPRYMAPEQAMGRAAGPPADIYAIGVMAFACLTGGLPHEGTAVAVLVEKQLDSAPDPALRAPGAPGSLAALCRRMLERDPAARPSAAEVLGLLTRAAPQTDTTPEFFVGREQELATLDEGYEAFEQRRDLVVVHVRGPSGLGKSRLCQEFRQRLRARGARVLHGRCRQQETVPYKGLDAIVDALSVHLRRLPPDLRASSCPADHDVLARLFPVLDELWPVLTSPRKLDPAARRRLGGFALIELLYRVSLEAPLVVHIDDFQWADRDSVELLERVASGQPRPAMLLLLSHRNETEVLASSPAIRELLASSLLAAATRPALELEPLPIESARALARALLPAAGRGDPPNPESQAEAIAMRAKGNPFFITQLVKEDSDTSMEASAGPDAFLVRRLARLDDVSRRLLELVAAFGSPLAVTVAVQCSAGAELEPSITALCEQGLLVCAEIDGQLRIEAAHDRVREVVLDGLEDRAGLHWRLGQALLAGLDEDEPRGGLLFAAADQLEAGLGPQLEGLSEDERLALATLQRRAGVRSLESSAWASARRYLRCARLLLDPWVARARAGQPPTEPCTDVLFALAQAEFAVDVDRGLALADELMSWELAPADFGRVHQWSVCAALFTGSWVKNLPRAIHGARRLGLRVPDRVSGVRAGLSFALGALALWRSGLLEDQGGALPQSSDPKVRSQADAIGLLVTASLFAFKPRMAAWALGRFARLVRAHCTHENQTLLFAMGVYTSVPDRPERARAMSARLDRAASQLDLSSMTSLLDLAFQYSNRLGLRPLSVALPAALEDHARLCKLAPQPVVEVGTVFALVGPIDMFLSPSRARALLNLGRQGADEWILEQSRHFDEYITEGARILSQGGPSSVSPPPSSTISPLLAASWAARGVIFQVALGDFAKARETMRLVPRNYMRVFVIGSICPVFAMACIIAELERPAGQTIRWWNNAVRRHRVVSHKYARSCPENYGPCHDVAEAEIAMARGQHQRASELYERARARALEQGIELVAGIAAHRLARHLLRCGQQLAATAAFDAAYAAYAAYEAPAMVQVVEAERAAAGLARGPRSGSLASSQDVVDDTLPAELP